MNRSLKVLFTTSCVLCCILLCNAQEMSNKVFYDLFDQKVGIENTDLYQGVLHKVEFRTGTDKTRFFENKNFIEGKVLYDGQWYHDLELKYDVEGDRVFLKLISKVGGGTLILFNDRLTQFEIGGSKFIKLPKEETPYLGISGFCEVSLQSQTFTLFTKYHKKRVRKKERKSMYYDFVDQANTYVLNYKQKYHQLNSKRDIKNLFPSLKKEIDKFYGIAKRLRRSDPEGFQVALFERVEVLLSQAANIE